MIKDSKKIVFKNKSVFIPNYLETNTSCIVNELSDWPTNQAEEVYKHMTFWYDSDYSSLSFFIVLSDQQIYFRSSPKEEDLRPSLLFYLEKSERETVEKMKTFFQQQQKYKELEYQHEKNGYITVYDSIFDFNRKETEKEDIFQGSDNGVYHPLTKKEAAWLVKRYIKIINEIAGTNLNYSEEKLKPVFFIRTETEKENIQNWTAKYPEIIAHEFID